MERKTLAADVTVKSADRGEVSAVISTFNVIDADGDITLPGAFDEGAAVPISAYGHTSWQGVAPVGKATIRQTAKEAIIDGQFFMNTAAGRDTFTAVKELGPIAQWSYGYDPTEFHFGEQEGRKVRYLSKLKTFEASPVLVAAGVNTRTLSAKSSALFGNHMQIARQVQEVIATAQLAEFKTAIRPHHTDVTARPWDAAAVVAAIPDAASVSDLRSVFAWVDGDPESKSAYRFPHHHGVGGPANVRALTSGIAVLNGARGGSTIPAGDRQGVYNHLATHLRDAEREPPELRSGDEGDLKIIDRLTQDLVALAEDLSELRVVGSARAAKGKTVSALTLEVLDWTEEELSEFRSELKTYHSPADELARQFARFVAQQR